MALQLACFTATQALVAAEDRAGRALSLMAGVLACVATLQAGTADACSVTGGEEAEFMRTQQHGQTHAGCSMK
jgi:hypothetical protein